MCYWIHKCFKIKKKAAKVIHSPTTTLFICILIATTKIRKTREWFYLKDDE